jgi:TetR/AcrR family transcriptional regulator, transcriptional repressor for nem operon
MVQNASSGSTEVGRPPEYDRDAVVSSAIYAFWEKGYAGTTLSDLEAATGVDRSTLYNSFDGKKGLFRSAARAYVAQADEQLFEPLHNGTDGIADVMEFIDRIDAIYDSDVPTGCLIVNDMGAVTDPDSTRRYLKHLEGGLRAALERASATGQVDPDLVVQRCQLLTAAIVGLNQINHSGTDTVAMDDLLEGFRSEIRSWGDLG